MGASCIIVCEGAGVSMTIKKLAQERGCTVITTPYDTYTAARLINQSMPISYFMKTEKLITFDTDDFIDDIKDVMASKRFRHFPVDVYKRQISGRLINYIKDVLPNLFGGSADLAPSNKTNMKDAGDFSKEDRAGRNLHFGVRELAMAAIGNGIMLHGGLRAYVSTFFVFSDYCKPMARLSAPVSYTHLDVYKRQQSGTVDRI